MVDTANTPAEASGGASRSGRHGRNHQAGKDMRDKPQLSVKDVWEVGEAYGMFMGRWSRLVAAEFLQWLSVPARSEWLDVGCGIGTLSRAILDLVNPARVVGIDRAPGFVSFADENIRDARAAFETGSAESLNSGANTYDAVVSGLVLNFVPQPDRAVSEMKRVVRSGGVVGAYVWDYADKMQLLRHFWDAAAVLDPQASTLDEGNRFPLCNAKRFGDLFVEQGLNNVEVRSIDVETHFTDFQDYWSPFLSGQGPAPSYVASLTNKPQSQLRELVRAGLPVSADGGITLTARAWAVRGYP